MTNVDCLSTFSTVHKMTSPNKAIELQLQIRQNAEELQDFVKDLESWEKDVKEKDFDLRRHSGILEKVNSEN